MKFLDLGLVDYLSAWCLQEELRNQVKNGSEEITIFCEHFPVITHGRLASSDNLKASKRVLDNYFIRIIQTNRGGGYTYHGPGMLVIYPVVNIRKRGLDAFSWLRKLEEMVVQFLNLVNCNAKTIIGKTGVWVETFQNQCKKICSIGVHISRGVSIHGMCINIEKKIPYGLELIQPCGLESNNYTFLSELGIKLRLQDCVSKLKKIIEQELSLNENFVDLRERKNSCI
ncbi:MAG: lipoyl(octanoyl) transferase LipB [Deltaproteobacteria bacterium]|nr:lipoyl(octanoyl) transferase LipB [Deltaproteobacteria bacterium]